MNQDINQENVNITIRTVGALLAVIGPMMNESGTMAGVLVGEFRDKHQDEEILSSLEDMGVDKDTAKAMLEIELDALLEIDTIN